MTEYFFNNQKYINILSFVRFTFLPVIENFLLGFFTTFHYNIVLGKFYESKRRKATGLRRKCYGSRVARRHPVIFSPFINLLNSM